LVIYQESLHDVRSTNYKILDKTGSTQPRDISPLPYVTMNPQPSVTPVQCWSQWKAVRTNGSNSVQLLSYSRGKNSSSWYSSPYAGGVWGYVLM